MLSVPPEVQLLLCCARSIVEPNIAERIRALVQEKFDWTYLIQIAKYHALTPLVYDNLYETVPEGCPKAVLDKLEAITLANATRNIFLTQELLKLLNLFAVHEIPVIPYKGPVLAVSSYRKPILRVFNDLDILVHTWDYHFRVDTLLASHGWRRCSDYGWQRGFVDVSGQVFLDVHEGITHREIPFQLSFNRAWKRCDTVSISGSKLRTFSPSDLLMILCVQIAKDVAANKIQLNKICDLAEFIRSHQDIDWEWILREARRLGVQTILYLGLHTAAELLDMPLPKDILQKGQAIKHISSLITHVRECIIGVTENTYSHPELLNKSRFHAEVRERIRDRVDPKYTYLISTNSYDYSFVRLPRALFLLYYVVRPIRLICKYGSILFRQILR